MLHIPNNPIAKTLIRARAEIEDENKWWPGYHETEVGGRRCAILAIGILDAETIKCFAQANGLSLRMPGASTIEFNDSHTHAEVLAAFDRAIATALTAGQGHD